MKAKAFALTLLLAGCTMPPAPTSASRCADVGEDLQLLNACEQSRNCTYTLADAQAIVGRVVQCAYTPPPAPAPKPKRVE